jgi:hypothetical protein
VGSSCPHYILRIYSFFFNFCFSDADLKVLDHVKKEAEGKQMELETAEVKVQKQKEIYVKYEEQMAPIRARLEVILKIEMDIGNLTGKKYQLTTK